MKMKGVSLKQNEHLTPENYYQILKDGVSFDGKNITLQLKNGMMSRLSIAKTALTGAHTKAVCCENGCCMPFISKQDFQIHQLGPRRMLVR